MDNDSDIKDSILEKSYSSEEKKTFKYNSLQKKEINKR